MSYTIIPRSIYNTESILCIHPQCSDKTENVELYKILHSIHTKIFLYNNNGNQYILIKNRDTTITLDKIPKLIL